MTPGPPDAADRLILDESAAERAGLAHAEVAVIGDETGALTVSLVEAGVHGIRAHADTTAGSRTLDGLAGVTTLPLGEDLVHEARVILLRLPRSLAALDDTAAIIAAHARADAVVFAGGRLKHMSVAMTEGLRARFDRVDVSHARQKSRVLIARGPRPGAHPAPERETIALPGGGSMIVCCYGGAFAGATLDIGTRVLLEHLPDRIPGAGEFAAIDLACGTGIIATALALRHPTLTVHASDHSTIAVASARATAAANGVVARVGVVRDDLLSTVPDASALFIALNPPFHQGAAVDPTIAPRMFTDAARVLRPGGELWCVWNSHLRYRAVLERAVGPTRQIARTPKFTVTASTRR